MNTTDFIHDCETRDETRKPETAPHPDVRKDQKPIRRSFDPEIDEWGDQLEED
ncbi:hypothetical protein [Bradyrhizobium sp.]|uniref:hypothetical protein n=1 Tax=Bradyrhizobium sp. TaxID=376 RepID=UPI003C78BF0A